VLGFIACFAAGSAALYAHLNAFAETKVIVIAGVIVYATPWRQLSRLKKQNTVAK